MSNKEFLNQYSVKYHTTHGKPNKINILILSSDAGRLKDTKV